MISMWYAFALLGVEIKDEGSMLGIEIGWQSVVYAVNGWKTNSCFAELPPIVSFILSYFEKTAQTG